MTDPFPGSVEVITVTGVSLLAGDGTPLSGAILFTPSRAVYIPGITVLEGSATMTVTAGVGAPVVVPCTDAVSPSFTYTITQRLDNPDAVNPLPVTGVTIPHATGATVDVSTLLEQFG